MILIVDDTFDVAELLVNVAKEAGYYADFALDGASACYKIERIYYSLALIDILLPPADGNELARKIKAMPEPHCHTPLIAMTGGDGARLIDKELFVHTLKKPFLPRQVRQVIERFASPPIKDLHIAQDGAVRGDGSCSDK